MIFAVMRAICILFLADAANSVLPGNRAQHQHRGVTEMLAAHCAMEEPRSDKTALYSMMYGTFLWPLRQLPSGKLLEIGLGCDQRYGPGQSARSWKKWFLNLQIWEAEYDAKCVQQTRAKMDALGINTLVGDQGNRTDLKRWLTESGGHFDAIIDDGSHRNGDIMTSFEMLWPALVPGGVYFIEDLITGRPARWDNTGGERVVIDILQAWSQHLQVGPFAGLKQHVSAENTFARRLMSKFPIPKNVAFVFCQYSACAVGKDSKKLWRKPACNKK